MSNGGFGGLHDKLLGGAASTLMPPSMPPSIALFSAQHRAVPGRSVAFANF